MAKARYALMIAKNSDDLWGWNGFVLDRQTEKRFPLIKTFVEYELQGEVGYGACAFDTKAELVAAAKKKARSLAMRGALQ